MFSTQETNQLLAEMFCHLWYQGDHIFFFYLCEYCTFMLLYFSNKPDIGAWFNQTGFLQLM